MLQVGSSHGPAPTDCAPNFHCSPATDGHFEAADCRCHQVAHSVEFHRLRLAHWVQQGQLHPLKTHRLTPNRTRACYQRAQAALTVQASHHLHCWREVPCCSPQQQELDSQQSQEEDLELQQRRWSRRSYNCRTPRRPGAGLQKASPAGADCSLGDRPWEHQPQLLHPYHRPCVVSAGTRPCAPHTVAGRPPGDHPRVAHRSACQAVVCSPQGIVADAS